MDARGESGRREKVPKDGVGPRGVPECYYTSRVLNSTARYVRFVNKLRALEEEERKGSENRMKDNKDKQCNDFFARCDRRSLINTVARRVDLCLASYEKDLNDKRQRLTELLSGEEESNIRKLVCHAQEGAAAVWQDKMERLGFLLAKRKSERENKYAATPLSKCAHIQPCLVKLRAKEAQEVQLYQMREKKLRKAAELEMENMWHELAMKESDALAVRMELDAMERVRRDRECALYTARQAARRREQRAADAERLRRDALALRADVAEWRRLQDTEKRKNEERRIQIAKDRKTEANERRQTIAQQQHKENILQDTWDSLRGQSIPLDRAKEERRTQKERDVDECNRKLVELKHGIARYRDNNEVLILSEGQRLRDARDLSRCLSANTKQRNAKETREANQQAVKEQSKLREEREQEAETYEYQRQVHQQLERLVQHKELTEAQARKLHQTDLMEQSHYNKLLKERAIQEELEQRKKCELAKLQYQQEIKEMLCRPYFSDMVHPFKKRMAAGVHMETEKQCPCVPEERRRSGGHCAPTKTNIVSSDSPP